MEKVVLQRSGEKTFQVEERASAEPWGECVLGSFKKQWGFHCEWNKKSLEGFAAAKSLQSCPTLCDPIDGSPPGSPIPGILQAKTLEWVASSFSNAWKWKVKVKSLSCVRLFATPWTAAYQAPPSMGFSRQEYWSSGGFWVDSKFQQCHLAAGWRLDWKWGRRQWRNLLAGHVIIQKRKGGDLVKNGGNGMVNFCPWGQQDLLWARGEMWEKTKELRMIWATGRLGFCRLVGLLGAHFDLWNWILLSYT